LSRKQNPHERLYVALDTPDPDRARRLARELVGAVGGFKVGLELFSSNGPALVRELRESGRIFLDLKFHDIPNTVAGATAAVARLDVDYLTVHASGGPEMIHRAVVTARETAGAAGVRAPLVLAVTVLTSLDDETLEAVGLRGPSLEAVERLAGLARDAGAGGLVCSAHEVRRAREVFPGGTLVVPGIRPTADGVLADDQARTATPSRAVDLGADLLVIGRPITGASDPAQAAAAIVRELKRSGPLTGGGESVRP
jgi:orotidine-5'-phosphate decarboxylase